MKKKLVCVLMGLSLLVPNVVMAEDTSDTTSDNGSSIVQKENQQENTEENAEQVEKGEESFESDDFDEAKEKSGDSEEKLQESEVPKSEEAGSVEASTDQSTPSEQVVISGNRFIITEGSKVYIKNGSTYRLSDAPISVGGKCYIPLRFVANQILEGSLEFDQKSKKIVLVKDQIKLQMTVGNKGAYLNGKSIMMDSAPITHKGTTYVPAKLVSTYFGYSVSYNSKNHKISIVGQDKGLNTKPVAKFYFSQSTYTEGQMVQAISTSYDPDGHELVDKRWSVVDEQHNMKIERDLRKIFKNPKAGQYRIGLKVKDQHGLWSEWTYEEITIEENKVPVITYLGTEKASYGQGEKINYQFLYENESWESIVNEKWTYRHADEDVSKAILGKPDVLFTEGDYIIALQLDDANGNRSEVCETTVHITDQVLSKELSYRFTQGNIGDIIDNYQGFNYRDYDDVNITAHSIVPGRMIMSDSPEQVQREGILYRDVINGKGRILIHHINDFSDSSVTGGEKRMVLVAENKTDEPKKVILGNKTIKGPVTDILFLGQKTLYDYLMGVQDEVITLKPGEKKFIYDSGKKWKQQTCISGLMDVTTDGEVTFTMAAISAGTTINTMTGMELLLPAVHPRGTFEGIGINYTVKPDSTKPTKIVLGNGMEEWVKGYDALMQGEAYNKGNYGVSYYITITAEEDMGIILNPRANVFRGAIEWKGDGVYNIPSSGTIYNNTAKAVSLGTIKAGETKTFEYMLPNGSSAPVVIGFIPKSYWDN